MANRFPDPKDRPTSPPPPPTRRGLPRYNPRDPEVEPRNIPTRVPPQPDRPQVPPPVAPADYPPIDPTTWTPTPNAPDFAGGTRYSPGQIGPRDDGRRSGPNAQMLSGGAARPEDYSGLEEAPEEGYLNTEQVNPNVPEATQAPWTPYSTLGSNGPNQPKVTSGNAEEMALQDRGWAYGQGASLDKQFTDNANYESNLRSGYRDQSDAAYGNLLNGGAGYNANEQSGILGQEGLDSLQQTDQEAQDSYLTGDEQSGIAGDPNRAEQFFRPNELERRDLENSQNRRATYQGMQGDLNAAVDPSRLRASEGFQGSLDSAVDGTESSIDSALSDPNASVSGDFLNDYRMSDQEQQDIETSAGITAGNRIRGAADASDRAARAAGMNPAGVAVTRQRFEKMAGGEAADANTKARVQASEAAAERMRRGEDMRVGYGQSLAGMKSGAAQNVGDMRMRAATTGEQTRLGAEQGVSDRQSRAAQIGGEAALDTEGRIADSSNDTLRYNMDTGMNMARATDDRATSRAASIAQSRQAATQYNQGERFKRGQAANDRTSARTSEIGGARIAGEQEGRAHLQDQQKISSQNEQNSLDRRGSLYSNVSGNAQHATATRSVAEGQPGKGERILGSLLGAGAGAAGALFGGGREKGGVISKPTYVLVGESGPEAIVPLGLDGDDDDNVLPSMALHASEPKPFNTAPPPMRGGVTYGQQYRYGKRG